MKEGWRLEKGVISGPVSGAPAGLVHGFATRALGDLSDPAAACALAARCGARRVRMLRQVHGVALFPPDAPEERPEGDGWVGPFVPGDLLAVRVADCLPVLLWREDAPAGAAVHAGWRGAVAGIARRAAARLGDPSSVHALLGPCIGKCCYEVGRDVADAAGNDSRWLQSLPPSGGEAKFFFDLAGFVAADLAGAGVRPERIHVLGLCTRCNPGLFFSHRGEGTKGRMAAFIGMAGGRTP